MQTFPLGRADIFIDIVDYDQKRAGLAGNNVQLILQLESSLKEGQLKERLTVSACRDFSRLFLQTPLLGRRYWKAALGENCLPDVMFNVHKLREKDCQASRADDIANIPLALSSPPVFRLDLIETADDRGAWLVLTWHHLLTDARGGEMLLRCLVCDGASHHLVSDLSADTALRSEPSAGFVETLKVARGFKPMVRRMKEVGVKSPAILPVAGKGLALQSIFGHFSMDETCRISKHAGRIHPLFGETALFLAACFKAVHSVFPHEQRQSHGYVAPVPLSTRTVAQARGSRWIPGNRVSICFIPVASSDVERLELDDLAMLVAYEFRDQVADGMPEAAEAAMEVARIFPKFFYRWIMRHSMDGQLCSFYFSNTGPVTIGGAQGEPFDVCGTRVKACFHRPMVSHPPGAGFFFSQYDSCIHMTTCFIKGAIEREVAEEMSEIIRSLILEAADS